MTESSVTDTATPLPESLPRCMRCNKPVDSLSVSPDSRHPETVIVEYHCHGESVRQEMSSSVLRKGRGLAGYTAFNDYTSALLPQR